MPPLDFPASPTPGQVYNAPNGIAYQWDGVKWIEVAGAEGAITIVGTSDTTNTIALGSHTLVTQAGKTFPPGSFITVVSRANPTVNWMWGPITAYDPIAGTMTMNAQVIGTIGTFADWTIMISGARGPQGQQGQQGQTGQAGGPGPPTGSPGSTSDLTGSYPSPTIKSSAVTNGKIADKAVTLAKINPNTGAGTTYLQTVNGTLVWSTGPSIAPTTPGGSTGSVQYKSSTGTFIGNELFKAFDTYVQVPTLHVPLGGKVGNLGTSGSDVQGNGGYIWSTQFYNLWQVSAIPGASLYYSLEQRRYYHNVISLSGAVKNGGIKLDYDAFDIEVIPYGPQANFTVVIADILNTSASREFAATEGLDRIVALKPSIYTYKVPTSKRVMASDIDTMLKDLKPGEEPDFSKFPGFADEGVRARIEARGGSPDGRGFIAEEFEEVYPQLVRTNREGNKGIGLDMDFYADLVASIKALKARVEELEAKVGSA